jgi:HK97 family phage portal protein
VIGRALVERRSTLRQPDQVLVDALTGGATYAGPTVNSSTALAHVDVFACVRVLAQSVGSLPLIVYRRTASGRERADDARIARLLAAPMPGVTQGGLFANATAHLQLWGNAYVAKYRDSSGAVSQLGLLDPSQMMVEVRGGEPFYRYARIEGEMSRRDILHVKGFSVDGVYGVSPIGQARQTLGLGLALEEHAARFFSNGAHPSGVIQMPVSPTEEQIKRFRESWDAMHSGTSRAHRPAILVGGASWQPIGMPPEDAQFVEQRKLSTTQVCRVFGVYPWMVFGDSGDSLTYANVEQQQIAFVTHSLRPWLVTIEQALAADDDLFGTSASGLYPEFLEPIGFGCMIAVPLY